MTGMLSVIKQMQSSPGMAGKRVQTSLVFFRWSLGLPSELLSWKSLASPKQAMPLLQARAGNKSGPLLQLGNAAHPL